MFSLKLYIRLKKMYFFIKYFFYLERYCLRKAKNARFAREICRLFLKQGPTILKRGPLCLKQWSISQKKGPLRLKQGPTSLIQKPLFRKQEPTSLKHRPLLLQQ